MKTFKDLEFKEHPISNYYKGAKQAILNFDNGYGVSVLFGSCFYSNGIDSYEVAVFYQGELSYYNSITDDVIGYISEEEITDIMQKVQLLK